MNSRQNLSGSHQFGLVGMLFRQSVATGAGGGSGCILARLPPMAISSDLRAFTMLPEVENRRREIRGFQRDVGS